MLKYVSNSKRELSNKISPKSKSVYLNHMANAYISYSSQNSNKSESSKKQVFGKN